MVCTVDGLTGHVVMLLLLCHRATDVAGSLPEALKRQGVDVRMVLPLYTMVRRGDFKMTALIDKLEVPLGEEKLVAKVLETQTQELLQMLQFLSIPGHILP